MVIKNDLKKTGFHGERKRMFLSDTTSGSEGTIRVFFQGLIVRSDKVKTLVEYQQRRCKETKAYDS